MILYHGMKNEEDVKGAGVHGWIEETCMMEAVPSIVGWRKKCRMEAVSTSGDIDSWNIYGGTLLGWGFDHLPSKGSLPKMSGCLQSG